GTHTATPSGATPADFPQAPIAAFVGPKWFDTPAVYGPLWTQVSALVARLVDGVAASIVVFRAIAIAASLGSLAILGVNPVVLFKSVASGHNDLLVALAVAAALALVFARRDLLATGTLALGALVQATAAVPLGLGS